MPLTAIEPNRTMPAPPRTGMGTRETTAPEDREGAEDQQDGAGDGDDVPAADPGE